MQVDPCRILFQLTTIDMIIYYAVLFNNGRYVRWSRPLRVLFSFTSQNSQKVSRSNDRFASNTIHCCCLDPSSDSKYFTYATEYCRCDVSLSNVTGHLHHPRCWYFKETRIEIPQWRGLFHQSLGRCLGFVCADDHGKQSRCDVKIR
jgi:hypothetical protein